MSAFLELCYAESFTLDNSNIIILYIDFLILTTPLTFNLCLHTQNPPPPFTINKIIGINPFILMKLTCNINRNSKDFRFLFIFSNIWFNKSKTIICVVIICQLRVSWKHLTVLLTTSYLKGVGQQNEKMNGEKKLKLEFCKTFNYFKSLGDYGHGRVTSSWIEIKIK